MNIFKHKHKFVIPVEWTYETYYEYSGENNRDLVVVPVKNWVSIMRCSCGEEASR